MNKINLKNNSKETEYPFVTVKVNGKKIEYQPMNIYYLLINMTLEALMIQINIMYFHGF